MSGMETIPAQVEAEDQARGGRRGMVYYLDENNLGVSASGLIHWGDWVLVALDYPDVTGAEPVDCCAIPRGRVLRVDFYLNREDDK